VLHRTGVGNLLTVDLSTGEREGVARAHHDRMTDRADLVRDAVAATVDGAAGAGVRWVGAQRTVLAGDLYARISLDRLAGLVHLYAVGPAAGLRGEITVVDGRAYVSRVTDGRVVVDRSFRHEAAFLVWAQVARWQEIAISETVADRPDLEGFVLDCARGLGMAPDAPFAFRVSGVPARVWLHVLDRRDDRPHSRELHEHIKVPFVVERCAVDIVGFCSEQHAGVFVPAGRRAHMHVCTVDELVAGHVDDIRLAPGMTLRLPAAS
jgi:acetolactate decarboxylase